jgi:hypothetical protein
MKGNMPGINNHYLFKSHREGLLKKDGGTLG